MTDIENYTKWTWKKKIKQKVNEKNWRDLLEWAKQYKKINIEDVKRKMKTTTPNSYVRNLNLRESRVLFRKSSSILQTVRLNWKNKYKSEGYDCIDCLSLEPPVRHPDHQDILMSSVCKGNSDLRAGRAMDSERGQAHFLIDLIARRNEKYGR